MVQQKRVHVGFFYIFEPSRLDLELPRHFGLEPGDVVRVVTVDGKPDYDADATSIYVKRDSDFRFMGLVDINSLTYLRRAKSY